MLFPTNINHRVTDASIPTVAADIDSLTQLLPSFEVWRPFRWHLYPIS
jgi:hypothetical protein